MDMKKELDDFQRMLLEHASDEETGRHLEAIFDAMAGTASDRSESARALQEFNARLSGTGERPNRRRARVRHAVAYAFAALSLPLMVATALLYQKSQTVETAQSVEPEWTELYVPFGETRDITLSDGTTLVANAGTRITYPDSFTGAGRKIFVDGEVLADVAHDEQKPFFMESRNVSVKVLGTKFDFKSYSEDDNAELTLLRGSVDFIAGTGAQQHSINVKPGEMVQYDRTTRDLDLSIVDTCQFRAFNREGALHFHYLKMTDVARELERRFNVKVIVVDPNLADTHYYAYFTNGETLEQIIETIGKDSRISIRRSREGNVYLSRR